MVLWIPLTLTYLSLTGLSPSLAGLPRAFLLGLLNHMARSEPRSARTPVWALSISLAATLEIEFSFSSSGYLDVSVHRVPFHTLWIGVWMTGVLPAGFPHSDICGSIGYLLLTAAFRSLSRLSSALSAKASTLRSFLLDLFRCIALHLLVCNLSITLLELVSIHIELILLVCFSDVLIYLKYNQLSYLCMKFSRYMRVLQAVRFPRSESCELTRT